MSKNGLIAIATITGVSVVMGILAKRYFVKEIEEEEIFEEATDEEGVISFAGEEGFEIEMEPETKTESEEEAEEDIPEEDEEREVHAWEEDDAIYEEEDDIPTEFELIGDREFETTMMEFVKNKFTYYIKDDVLASDEDMKEQSVEDTIGHEVLGLLLNNPYSNSLYIRYPTLGADYEVKMDSGSFVDACKELDVGGTD